jgi:hypothetical protein
LGDKTRNSLSVTQQQRVGTGTDRHGAEQRRDWANKSLNAQQHVVSV